VTKNVKEAHGWSCPQVPQNQWRLPGAVIAFPHRSIASSLTTRCELRQLCHNETVFPTPRKLELFRTTLRAVNCLPFYRLP
jgi:hypothetical protein